MLKDNLITYFLSQNFYSNFISRTFSITRANATAKVSWIFSLALPKEILNQHSGVKRNPASILKLDYPQNVWPYKQLLEKKKFFLREKTSYSEKNKTWSQWSAPEIVPLSTVSLSKSGFVNIKNRKLSMYHRTVRSGEHSSNFTLYESTTPYPTQERQYVLSRKTHPLYLGSVTP